LLGFGEDGHDASLSGKPATQEPARLVADVHGAPKPPPDRVTLTSPSERRAPNPRRRRRRGKPRRRPRFRRVRDLPRNGFRFPALC
jgi:hypothetical protein